MKYTLFVRCLSFFMILCMLAGLMPAAALSELTTPCWTYELMADGSAQITGYTDPSVQSLTVPQSLDGAWVRSIAAGALLQQTSLTQITVPTTVTTLGEAAFPAGVTVCAYHGSAALDYANESGLPAVNRSAYDFTDVMLDLSEISSDQWRMTDATLTLQQPFADLAEAGACLYMPAGYGYPQGRPVRVLSREVSGDAVLLTVQDMAFGDAIASYHVENMMLSPDYSRFIPAEGVTVLRSYSKSNTYSSAKLPILLSLAGGGISCKVSFSLQASAKIITSEYSLGKNDLDVELSTEISDVQIDLKGSTAKKRLDVGTFPFIGNGLLSLWARVYFEFGIDGEMSVHVDYLHKTTRFAHTQENGLKVHENSYDTGNVSWSAAVHMSGFFGLDMFVQMGFPQAKLSITLAKLEIKTGLEYEVTKNIVGNADDYPCLDSTVYLILDVKLKLGFMYDPKNNSLDPDKGGYFGSGPDNSTSGGLKSEFAFSFALPKIKERLNTLHWEECKVWQEECTWGDNETCTFEFITNCEAVVPSQSVKKGETPSVPAAPEREGYTFAGWFIDAAGTTAWVPEPAVEALTRIYAMWDKKPTLTPIPASTPTPTPTPTPSPTPVPGGTSSLPADVPIIPEEYLLMNMEYYYDSTYGGYVISKVHLKDIWTTVYDENGQSVKTLLYDWPIRFSIVFPSHINGIPLVGLGIGDFITSIDADDYSIEGDIEYDYELGDYNALVGVYVPPTVKFIGRLAFYRLMSPTVAILSDGLVSIGEHAFNSSNLSSVRIPSTVVTIGSGAFRGCPLTSISIPASVKYIGQSAFTYTACSQVYIPDTVEEWDASIWGNDSDIGLPLEVYYNRGENSRNTSYDGQYGIFYNVANIKKITLADGVKVVHRGEFEMRDRKGVPLEELIIPSSVTEIQQNAFAYRPIKTVIIKKRGNSPLTLETCSLMHMENVIFEDGTTVLPVFNHITKLKTAVLPDEITVIPARAFHCAYELASINIPSKLQVIEEGAFWGCHNLKALYFPSGVTEIGEEAFSYSGLEQIAFNDGLRIIGAHAFGSLKSNITEVLIPASVECVGDYAFAYNEALERVTIKASESGKATQLGQGVFGGCPGLKEFRVEGDIVVAEEWYSLFSDITPDMTFYLHRGSQFDTYMQANYPNANLVYFEDEDTGDQEENKVPRTLTFDLAGHGENIVMQVMPGDLITPPEDPTAPSHRFMGWYKSALHTRKWNFYQDVMPDEDLKLYANWVYHFSTEYVTENDMVILTSIVNPQADCTVPMWYNEKVVVGLGALCVPDNVQVLRLPASMQQIDPQAFVNASSLQEIIVAEGCEAFYALDGVLFAADGTLVCYPAARPDEVYATPEGITTVGSYAFAHVEHLRQLDAGFALTVYQANAFYNCQKLECINLVSDPTAFAANAFNLTDPFFYGPEWLIEMPAIADAYGLNYNMYPVTCWSQERIVLFFYARMGELVPEIPDNTDTVEKVLGWTQGEGGELWNFATDVMPAAGLELYAVWGSDYEYELDENGNATLTSYTGTDTTIAVPDELFGHPVTAIADGCFPAGTTLIGDPDGFVQAYAESNNCVFQAKMYTIFYNANGGSVVADKSAAAGSEVTLTEAPVKDGYFFSCWVDSSGAEYPLNTAFAMPDGDLHLIAQYTTDENSAAVTGFSWRQEGQGITLTGCSLTDEAVVVPAKINGLPITAIDNHAFEGCGATSITLPDTITTIGQYAFSGCRKLKSIALPEGVTVVAGNTFDGCLQLTAVTLPEGLTTIERSALNGCISLAAVALPASVTDVDPQAFAGCTALSALSVAEGNAAYQALDGVLFTADGKTLVLYPQGKADASYTLPEGVTALGSRSMQGSLLQTLTLNDSLTVIGTHALYGAALKTLVCAENGALSTIDAYAFASCRELQEVTLPDSVTTVGHSAFAFAPITKATLGANVVLADQVFTQTTRLVLYGVKNSPAHQWAQQHGVRFIDPASDIPVSGMTLQAAALLPIGETLQLTPVLTPANTTETNILWSSSAPTIARVDQHGLVTALFDGTTVITARIGRVEASCTITVPNAAKGPESLSFGQSTYSLFVGEDVYLDFTLEPYYASRADIVWTLSDPTLADWYAADGILLPKKAGTLILTATLENGRSFQTTIVIREEAILQTPAFLTDIGEEAFMNTGFSTVICSDRVHSIGTRAFADCRNLWKVYIGSNVTSIAPDVFEDVDMERLRIYGVEGSYAETYANANGIQFFLLQ